MRMAGIPGTTMYLDIEFVRRQKAGTTMRMEGIPGTTMYLDIEFVRRHEDGRYPRNHNVLGYRVC